MRLLLRLFGALACAAVAAGMSDDEVVTLAHPHGPVTQQMLELAARDFERARGWKVDVQEVGWGELSDYILGRYKADAALPIADIVTIGSTWAADFYEKGVLSPMGDLYEGWRRERRHLGPIEEDLVKNLDITYSFPGNRDDKRSPPEWHAVPLDVDTRIFFYRKDLQLKYLKHANPPKTIEEALYAGQVIRDGERAAGREMSGWAVPSNGKGASDALQVLLTFVVGNGSTLVGPQEACTFTDEYFKTPLGRYAALYGTQHDYAFNHSLEISREFAQGKVAMMAGAAWMYWGMVSGEVLPENVGIGSIPSGPRGPYTFQGGTAWAIPSKVPGAPAPTGGGTDAMDATANKKKRAFDFIAWFSDPANGYMKDMTLARGLVPGYKTTIREAKLTGADGVQLGELALYDEEGDPLPLAPSQFANPDGVNAMQDGRRFPVGNLAPGAAGDWIDFNKAAGPAVEVAFPRGATVASYAFTSGGAGARGFERDPVEWVVSYKNATGGWTRLESRRNPAAVELKRNVTGVPQAFAAGAVTAAALRFDFVAFRESMCGTACQAAVDMFPFAVPLQYPHQGFYKFGRVEHNATVDRMLQRLHRGDHIDAVTSDACREWDALMVDPARGAAASDGDGLVWIISGVAGGVVGAAVVVTLLLSKRATHEIHRLKNDVEIAEELADAVAVMNPEVCEYLYDLKNPTRIQRAFKSIVKTLKEYRAYLPENLRCAAEPGGEEDSLIGLDVLANGNVESERARTPRAQHGYPVIPRAASSSSVGSAQSAHSSGSSARAVAQKDALAIGALTRKRITVVVGNAVGWLRVVAPLSDRELIERYRRYITQLAGAVAAAGGSVDTFSGDRVTALFNATKSCSDQMARALSVPFKTKADGLRFAFGCSMGVCRMGNLGNDAMRKFTIIGSDLSYANALQEYAKTNGALCVVDHTWAPGMQYKFKYRYLGAALFMKRSAEVLLLAQVEGRVEVEEAEWMYQIDTAQQEGQVLFHYNRFASAVFRNEHDVAPPAEFEDGGERAARILAAYHAESYTPLDFTAPYRDGPPAPLPSVTCESMPIPAGTPAGSSLPASAAATPLQNLWLAATGGASGHFLAEPSLIDLSKAQC